MSEASFGLEERPLRTASELAERAALLASRGLTVPEGEGLVLGLYQGDRLVATGALVRNVLQGIAVDADFEGEGAAAAIVTSLIKRAIDRDIGQLFLFSTNEEAPRFESLGFSRIASVPGGAALLEWGSEGIERYLNALREVAREKPRRAGAVVVNCNPFTAGHRALIEYAAVHSPWLYVLVVEEDRSLIPFEVRLKLIREGTSDLPNVTVIAGGPYIISSATFPTYFIRPDREEAAQKAVRMHAALDLVIFRTRIAPVLGVVRRFVGTEPYCDTTSAYNETMKVVLPATEAAEIGAWGLEAGTPPIEVVEIPRFEIDGKAVSASKVRNLIREGRLSEVERLVPPTTWEWFCKAEAAPVLEKIRHSDSRH